MLRVICLDPRLVSTAHRQPPRGGWRWAGVITVVCCLTVLAPQETFAQDARITFSFLRPGGGEAQVPRFSFEMLEPVERGDLTLPVFKIASADAGTKMTNSTLALPVLSLGGLSITPEYGEQKFGLLASSLRGLKVKSQKVRGLSLSTEHGSNSFTLMLGQLSGKKTGVAGVPSVLGFTGTLKASSRLTFAPRVVTRLGSQSRPGTADTSAGAGVSAALSSNVKLIGDFAGARTKRGRWVPSTVVGSVGKWSRGSVEASVRRADSAYKLMGRVKGDEENQELVKGQLTVVPGFEVTGQLTTSRPRGKREDDTGRATQALTFDIDKVGTLKLTRKQVTRRSRLTDELKVEWRHDSRGKPVVRLTQERERRASSDREGRLERQVQVEFKGSAGERMSLSGRTSVLLSDLAPDRSRLRSRLKGSLAVGGRLELTGEAEYDLFGTRPAWASIGKVRVAGDLAVSDRTTLHLVYARDPNASGPRSYRIVGQISRVISF